ncbi:MAG: hypothetical protein GXP19_05220 [Gammaproteobacteria bacterium]|nr:hypothetical protein [Gammaproteobacteria bacterium]
MKLLNDLIEKNKHWAAKINKEDSDFFIEDGILKDLDICITGLHQVAATHRSA